jgi:predicted N-acetyltransferase YhbS
MAVHPEHQLKGHGRQLLDWGLQQAEEEKVDIRLLASPNAKLFYERSGFQAIGEGNFPPLTHIEFGPVMEWRSREEARHEDKVN